MYVRRGLLLLRVTLMALLLVGCAGAPVYKGVATGGNTNYVLGIVVDEQRQVMSIVPDSAAAHAGVQVGDTLVSLTWILSEAPTDVAHLPAGNGTEENPEVETTTASVTPIRPPAGVEYKTVPFTEPDAIRTLIGYGVPLRLEILRAGRVQQLTIIPTPSTAENNLPTSY